MVDGLVAVQASVFFGDGFQLEMTFRFGHVVADRLSSLASLWRRMTGWVASTLEVDELYTKSCSGYSTSL